MRIARMFALRSWQLWAALSLACFGLPSLAQVDDPPPVVVEAALPFAPDFVCADVSFISLRLVLPAIAAAAPGAAVLALVKPQFEVGREQVGKGGVVRDDALRAQAVADVAACAAELGYRVAGQADSRLAGPKGNREVFLHLVPAAADPGDASG